MISKGVKYLYQNTTLKSKILFLFLPIMVAMIFLLGQISNSIYNHYILELTRKDLLQRAQMLNKDFEFKLSFFKKMLDDVYIDTNLKELLTYYQNNQKSYTEMYDDYKNQINPIFKRYTSENQYYTRLYLSKSNLLPDGGYIQTIDKFPVKGLIDDIQSDRTKIYLNVANIKGFSSERQYLIISSLLRNQSDELIAIASVEVDISYFEGILKIFDVGEKGWYRFRAAEGPVILSSNTSIQDDGANIDNNLFFTLHSGLDTILEASYSEELILEMGTEQRKALYFTILSFVIASALISIFFSSLATKRMKLFIDKIKHIEIKKNLIIQGNDEIAVIDGNFNQMLKELNESVEKKHQLELEKKMIESDLLQAQFNPHFLYNTLSAIRWSVLKNGDLQSADILDKLVLFYRSALSGGRNIIPISKEIEIIERYFEIQKYTYDQNYSVYIDMAEDVKDLFTLKFILQPIVENALLHGIYSNNEDGFIRVIVNRKEDKVCFTIIDNGRGTPEETLLKLNNRMDFPAQNDKSGYGVFNVIRRIKLFYGEEFGVFYESTEGFGTKVSITIPVCTSEKDHIPETGGTNSL